MSLKIRNTKEVLYVKGDHVVIKGTPGVVYMIFDDEIPVMEILEELRVKIREHSAFFKGSFNICVTGREFTNSDKLRISCVMKTILPEASVRYDS